MMPRGRLAQLVVTAPLALGCGDPPPGLGGGPGSPASDSDALDPSSGPSRADADAGADAPPTRPPPPSGGREGSGGGGGESGGVDDDPLGGGPGLSPLPGPPFVDVSVERGVQVPHLKALGQWGMGIAWRDFDRDGDEDVFVTGGQLASVLLRNDGAAGFTAVESDAVAALTDTAGASWADVDDDGWPELLVLGRDRGWLLHNDAGMLVDVTVGSGLGLQAKQYGQSAAWADIDGNGTLDLFVAHSTYRGNTLHLGQGDGTFVDVSGAFAGIPPLYPLAAGFFDVDDDGDADLYVVHDRYTGNHLFRNDGPGCGGHCMVEIGEAMGAATPVQGMGLAVGDPDEDGDFDLFFTDSQHAHLLRNEAPGPFVDVSEAAGVSALGFGWGAAFLDYDGDGRLDLYEGLQSPAPGRNRLFLGRGDGTFEDRSEGSGAACPGESMSVAVADYDGDGAPDLLVGNENEDYRLYRNRRGDRGWSWLTLELRGGGPVTRDAVGTRVVVVTASGRRLLRQVEIGSGFGSSNSPRLHVGVTTDPAVAVEVYWPDGVVSHPWPPAEAGVWVIDYPR